MALNIAIKRLTKEVAELQKNALPGIRIKVSDENLFLWKAEVDGPKDSPYEGGIFHFTVKFSSDYPMTAPKVKCETRVFHVNINGAGTICLDLLKNKWTPVLTAQAILEAIRQLLAEPNPEDPLVPSLATLANNNPEEYLRRAKLFTSKYAKPKSLT